MTVIGLPLAIAVFIIEQRKERSNAGTPALPTEQHERMRIIFSMLRKH